MKAARPWFALVAVLLAAGCASSKPPPPQPLPVRQALREADNAANLSRQRRWDAAAQAWQRALDQFRLLNDSANESVALHNLAQTRRELGDLEAAAELFEAAGRVNEQAGRAGQWWRNQIALLQIERLAGNDAARKRRLENLATRLQTLPDPEGRALYLNELGLFQKQSGDLTAALESYQEAEAGFQRTKNVPGLAAVAANRARLRMAQADYLAARLEWQRALRWCEQLADPPGIARALAGQGEALLAAHQELPVAAELLRRATENFKLLGMAEEEHAAAALLEKALAELGR